MRELTISAETTVTADTEELSRAIGEQLILERDSREFAYLAGIALDGLNGESGLVEILMEYLKNERELDLSEEQLAEIEGMLEEAYDE